MQQIYNSIHTGTKRLTLATVLLLGFFTFGQLPTFALQSVTLAWDASPDPTVLGYNVYYGAASGTYTNKVDAVNATSATISNLVEGVTYYFAVTAYNGVGLESDPSNEAIYTVPLLPAVVLANPANGATYTAPATISLTANVTPNGHTITQVEFFNGSTSLGTAASAPYTVTWNSVSAGSYNLKARVVYDSGATLDSASASVTVNNPPPVLALTAPATGASYLAPAIISLAASVTTNSHTITQVQFYNGTTLLGSDALPPYTYGWNSVGAGSYTVKARVVYDSGATLDSATASVTVTNPLPVLALTAPASGATYLAPATVNLAASVTTNGHTISQVQFYNGATLLGTDTLPPYTFAWNSVSAGSYNVNARLVFDGGATLDTTAASVTVTNGLPVVALSSPANGAKYLAPATINLAATVTTNGHSISLVEFYNSTTLLGTDTLPPYTFSWSSISAGSYSLKARVVYDGGATLDSAAASVTVTNPLPVLALTAPATGSKYLAPATISLAASVTTNGHTITQVQFYNGTTLLGAGTLPPYTFDWTSVVAGSYSVKARLVYDSGLTLDSTAASVTVTNPLAAPSIALTAPANGANYLAPANISLSASVTANGHSLSKVQFYNGASLLGEKASAPYTYAWNSIGAGSYSLSARLVYDGTATMNSAAASVTVTNPMPLIVLDSPINGAIFSAPGVINCTASVITNGHTITKVQFYNRTNLLGEVESAPYSLAWDCTNSGLYSLTARVVFDSDSTSDSAAASVTVRPAPPLNVTVDGGGTVTPNLSAQLLVVGNTYTVTATPDADQQFDGWTGSINSWTPTVSFVLTTNFSLKAHFKPTPTNLLQASYYGLFYESNQVQQTSSGAFVLSMTKKGRYSGRLQLGGARLAFHGVFDSQGRATNSIVRRGMSPLSLEFHLAGSLQADQIQGTLSADAWLAGLSADRAVFSPKFNPAPLQGSYTLLIPGQDQNDPTLPSGHSFGLVRIDAGGQVRLAASLADGTKFSQSAPLSPQGLWGLYAPLYAGQGSLLSWLSFTNRPSDDFNGALSWIKPANSHARCYTNGFSNDCQALGSAYVPPVLTGTQDTTSTNATVSFAGGNLVADFANLLSETSAGRLSNLSSNRLSMSVSRTTGAFRGSVTDPSSGKSKPFAGALFQKLQAGYGFMLGLDQSSRVDFTH